MWQYILLGLVQGLTEFLPVSSSGHLVILQHLLGFGSEGLALDVVLHLGTGCAVLVFFFKDILRVLREIKSLLFVLIVTMITGVIAVAGKDFFESLFGSPRPVAIALLFTGLILLLTKMVPENQRSKLTVKDAVVLGFAQALAIIPGISRSGTTISTLLFRKIDRETAFKFSFLVSLPVIFGAALLEARKIGLGLHAQAINFSAGFLVSFVTGLIALRILKAILLRAKLYYFGFYCLLLSLITLLFVR